MNNERMAPVKTSERYVILDALRGFAILGICAANYPEFSLYTFQSKEIADAMPTAGIDRVLRFMLYFLVDGKFYTLFSLLFGIGFSIIISNAARKGVNGFRIFYRRMALLTLIGFLHLMFIWSGDILMLYALLGMCLPLLRHVTTIGLAAGLPLSLLYAWSCMNGHPLGNAVHTAIYTVSVYPLGLAYMCGMCLMYLRHNDLAAWRRLAYPGRMALTNYIGQSVIGALLFYGIGLGLGASFGLVHTELIVAGVYLFQMAFSRVWLRFFRFGPLEWIWRMLTYGRWFDIRNDSSVK